ncbi:MAG TPA: 2Fe-2S iron-sulfur cluster binding domain-containing protein [Thioalkalivibrio sp.]|nr:2Fe-2S iron-sulfur cluster binding domain-containing protein [Thioalkalivibrio sp.]
MPTLRFDGQAVTTQDGETVLEALLRHGLAVPHGCRSGICQSCLLKAREGHIPAPAQAGLKPALAEQDYLLACRCVPDEDMVLEIPSAGTLRTPAEIAAIEPLGGEVIRLVLTPEAALDYRPGQYVTLWRDEQLGRSYSLASLPDEGQSLEFHVRVIPGGQFSGWLAGEARPGDRLEVQEAAGSCVYTPALRDANLLLVGTGTGLAPLWGIVREALRQGHRGQIRVMHGAVECDGLYLHEALKRLAAQHDNLHYHASVLRPEGCSAVDERPLDELVVETIGDFSDWHSYLCGAPELVNQLRRRIFLAGARMDAICADAFLPTAPAKT